MSRCEDCGTKLNFQLHCPKCDGNKFKTPLAVAVIFLVLAVLLVLT